MRVEDNIHNYLETIGFKFKDWDINGGIIFYSKDDDKTIKVLVEEV